MVAIVCTYVAYPEGSASTHMVHLLGRGLVQAGRSVVTFLMSTTENLERPVNRSARGTRDRVMFEYATGTPIRSRSRLGQFCRFLRALVVVSIRLASMRVEGRLDAIICYGQSGIHVEWLFLLSRVLRVPLIVYVVEWYIPQPDSPLGWRQKNNIRFIRSAFSRPEGVVVISRFLACKGQRERLRGHRRPRIARTPILVDPDGWRSTEKLPARRPFFVFCAFIDAYLSDALFLVDALAQVSPEFDLIMIGQCSDANAGRIADRAKERGVGERVIQIRNFLPSAQLYTHFRSAEALLAPLHWDDRSLARFPSKIGDYLMSGRPVVTSAVGEAAEYLTDGLDAFLCAEDTPLAFGRAMMDAVRSEDREAIGRRGRRLAERVFDYRRHGRELSHFIDLCGRRQMQPT